MKRSLLLTFSFFTLLVLAITLSSTALIYEFIYNKEYDKSIMDSSSRTLYSMDSALNSLYSEVYTFSSSVVANQSLHELITESNESYTARNELLLETVLYHLTLSTQKISAINVFDINGRHYRYEVFNGDDPPYRGHYNEQKWYVPAADLHGGSTSFLWENPSSETSDYTGLCIARQLIDFYTLEEIGFVTVDINSKVLSEIFSPFTKNYNSSLYLLDTNGNHFMSFVEDGHPDLTDLSLDNLSIGSQLKTIHGMEYAIDICVNKSSNLTLISLSPTTNIDEGLAELRLMTLIILGASISLALLSIIFLTKRLLNPINALIESMGQVVEKEEFNPVYTPTRDDEIGRLKNIYNHMIDTIQKLLTRSIKEEQLKRKSELKALQAQIKPHFLYNTFDSISSLALLGDTETVYHALQHLSAFYRMSLSNGKEYIPLDEEIMIVHRYCEILKIRFPETFEVNYEISEETRKILLPKLTLQPFVENAIHHGIFTLGETGIITIRSWMKDNLLVIEIEDNGKGMSQSKIDYLLDPDINIATSFGARSTIERIRLLYDAQSDVQITSVLNQGTSITITLLPKEYYYE